MIFTTNVTDYISFISDTEKPQKLVYK